MAVLKPFGPFCSLDWHMQVERYDMLTMQTS